MERGEPPGRHERDAERQDAEARPVRLSVRLTVQETFVGSGKPILKEPFADVLYGTSASTPGEPKGKPLFLGATAIARNGVVEHAGTLLVPHDSVDLVRQKTEANLRELLSRYKMDGALTLEDDRTAGENADGAVELKHETAPGHDQRGQNDGDPVGAEISQA